MADAGHPRFSGSGVTATGGRPHNEDAFLAASPVFVVADGMGGHVAGAAAARAVVEAFRGLAGGEAVTPVDVVRAVHQARVGVADVSERAGGDSGSTLTGAVAVIHQGQPWWMVINVGDSRVYALEGGALTQITVDHSRVQELVAAGRITPAEALVHPDRNIVTRAIGDDLPGQDAWLVPLVPGRRLIVASDGLMKAVEDAGIAAIAAAGTDAATTASSLVDAALAAHATDNVTVVVADADGVTPADASPEPWPAWGMPEPEDDTAPSGRSRRV